MRRLLTVGWIAAACSAPAPAQPRPLPTEPPAPAAAPLAAPAPVPPAVPPLSPTARTEDESNTIAVFKAAAPATVYVTQNQTVRDRYTLSPVSVPAGAGTGFLWDTDGHVVTNAHVLDGGQSFTVTLFDGSDWPARVIGSDPRKDIAVLRIDAPADRLVALQRKPASEALEVGQKTIAIGNPFGLDHTLTTGIVSALGREIVGFGEVTIKGMIQTDAAINPGNSGGPLLDSTGRLIGVNTMIYSQAGQSAGIGFAVPVGTVERVVEQLIHTGRVTQVGIGVTLLPDAVARRAGLRGVAILEVHPASPAAALGLRGVSRTPRGVALGDVLVAVDGHDVATYDDLYNALDGRQSGEAVTLVWERDGVRQEGTTRLTVVSE